MFGGTSLNSHVKKKYFNLLPDGALLLVLEISYLSSVWKMFPLKPCIILWSFFFWENSSKTA